MSSNIRPPSVAIPVPLALSQDATTPLVVEVKKANAWKGHPHYEAYPMERNPRGQALCRGLSSYTLVSSSIMDCISFLKLHHLFISETTKISLFSTGKGNQIKYFNHSSEHYQDSLLLLLTMV